MSCLFFCLGNETYLKISGRSTGLTYNPYDCNECPSMVTASSEEGTDSGTEREVDTNGIEESGDSGTAGGIR